MIISVEEDSIDKHIEELLSKDVLTMLSNRKSNEYKKAKFLFGDIVVVDEINIGVVVKTWRSSDNSYSYEVYVRMLNGIETYPEDSIERYRVRHKYLDDQEVEWQNM